MFVSFARNFVQSRDVCEDLVQEAFVALLEQGCTFDNEYMAKGFLYKTLRNKCLNHLRHEQIRNRYAEMQAAHYKHERNEKKSEEFFIDAIMREESSLIISQAIEGLPEMGRQVLNMSIEGLTNQEIADALAKTGIKLDKRKITIAEPIKNVGTYTVTCKLGYEISAPLTVKIVEA